jgi:hypothetical protein
VDQCCPETDFMYPMMADIYYPVISQTDYGQASKKWVLDRTIILNATPVGGAGQEDIKPEIFLQYENKLVSRVKEDPRISTSNGSNAITNILIANIRNAQEVLIYKETAGARAGRGTIYELGTVEPFTGPFGSVEYYKMLLRRAENQTVGD